MTTNWLKDGAFAAAKQIKTFAVDHPYATTMVGSGLVLATAPGLVAAPILGAAGFTANGVAAGSVAAGVQGGIGSVAAPGLFATLQSAGAGGYGVAAVHSAFQGAGAAVSSASALAAWLNRRRKGKGGAKADSSDEKADSSDEKADTSDEKEPVG